MSKELLNKGQTSESLEPGEDQIEIDSGLFGEEEKDPDINKDPTKEDILETRKEDVSSYEDLINGIDRNLTDNTLSEEFDFDGDGY